jgi:hypothetical protein
MTFGAPTSFVSFLWGSPDNYNTLTVDTNLGSYNFQSSNLLGLVYNGDQSFASYVGFTADAGEFINSLSFHSTSNAFEVANFSVTAPVPEPETYALMLAGLGVVGFALPDSSSVGERPRSDPWPFFIETEGLAPIPQARRVRACRLRGFTHLYPCATLTSRHLRTMRLHGLTPFFKGDCDE